MHTCGNCLLNDNIPSVRIGADGLCNYCSNKREDTGPAQEDRDDGFAALLKQFGDRRYQVIMAYSGGKDSTFTMKRLHEKYRASILAVTFNNGFLSESSLENISTVTDYLGIDSMIVKYPSDKLIKAFRFVEDGRTFPKTSLERASAICNLCIMFVKNMIYYEAIVRNIPVICFGWTPGQVDASKPLLKLNYRMVSMVFEHTRKAIADRFGSGYDKYFLDPEFMKCNEDRIPYLYYPFAGNRYNEEDILEEIRGIGWKQPSNTDGNSSNCLLNSYANQSHMDRFGFHPYAFEIGSMIRNGFLTREQGLEKLQHVRNEGTYKKVRARFEEEEGRGDGE